MKTNPITIINNGGVGVLVTDTIYGIVGRALDQNVVKRIYKIKGRDKQKPFIVLISSIADLASFNVTIDNQTEKILKTFWPGSVSIILPCAPKKFAYLHRGANSLAFRLPKKKSLAEILKETGPLVAPRQTYKDEHPHALSERPKNTLGMPWTSILREGNQRKNHQK